jgi:hypothetical protein
LHPAPSAFLVFFSFFSVCFSNKVLHFFQQILDCSPPTPSPYNSRISDTCRHA